MSYVLKFDQLFEYDIQQKGITLETTLKYDGKAVTLLAKLDTGSTDCIFARKFGEELGLNIEQGDFSTIGTSTGNFGAYLHEITLSVLGYEFEVYAFFAESEAFDRNVLGRTGFLDRVVLGLVDYEGKLFLNRYDY